MFEATLFITMCAMWNGEQICTDKHAATFGTPVACQKAREFYNEAHGQPIFQCKKRKLEKIAI
jgi:hypothetical protein